MTRITIDDATRGIFGKANDEAELVDAAGNRFGYYLTDDAYRRLVCRWANLGVSDSDLEEARREPKSFSTAEVQEHLRSL
jgi:hypothetical protein